MVMLKLEEQPQLIQAIFSGEIDDVRNLLDSRPDVNYQDAEKRSPLHAAAFKGDRELAELLLAQGARVNTKDCKWLTPLHRACGVGSEDTVALLLSHNADTTARDRQWQTPLHIAAANNAVECVSHLLHYVPNVNVTDRSGRTALHHAALNGHNDVVELLISKGCIVNACDKKDCRPIHWAAHLGHVETMELLMRNGADINVKDRNQYTPLHVAAASGMLYACRLLLHAGADVDAQNSFGNTPMHIACLNGHLPVCQELAMYSANLEAINYRGQTPLHISAASTHGVACLTFLLDQNVNLNKQSSDGRTALHMSAIHGRFTRSKTLIDKGAIVDSQDKNGNTALHIAAQYGHDILTTTLLEYGADPNKRGYEGRTPLHSCCLSGFVEVSRKFIQIKVDLNTRDDTGKTPVHCAAYKGSVECLDLLVSQGADFKLQDMYGRTPLHYSSSQGHYTCVFTLVGIGAPVNVFDNEGCTPLHLAAAYDLEGRCVEYLLQHKADPKLKDSRGYTPVHYAANGSNSNSLGHLLEAAGKNYNFQEDGMPLNTPLHLAARGGDIKILNSVISYFPDVNIKNETGCTPLLIAAREGHTHSVQMLLRYGAKVGLCEDVYNMSPVHYSAKNGHMHCLALLVDNTEDKNIIDKPDKFNRTALMLSISGSHIKCVLTLLKSEANPNIADSDRHSSLFRAVVTNQKNVVQYLISKGAFVSEPDINGKTVLHLASACGHFVCLQTVMLYMPIEKAASLDNHDFSALHWGCYHGYYTCVEYLLQKGVFKKIEGNPFSPVHCATFVGSERCLELLYNAFGAEIVKLTDTRRRTPLHIAALHGHSDCARYLLEQGAEIESKDEFGRTALIAASQNGQSQMLELLIAYKANVKSCDNNGNTALHTACLKRHSHTALLLLEYINDIDTINMVNNDKKTPLHLSARNGLVEVTRNLIKKGSSVLAVDSNGLTPALCCAPNASVAQCLAIILANHPTQVPAVNHSTKVEDEHLFQRLVANLSCSNVSSRSSLIQTDMSLQRDPCELFDAIVQKIKPDYVKKALKVHRRKPHVFYCSPVTVHKPHKLKSEGKAPAICNTSNKPNSDDKAPFLCDTPMKEEIILIEKYDKSDTFDPSFNEPKGLGLHRSFSDISLASTIRLAFDKDEALNNRMAELMEFHEIIQDDVIVASSTIVPVSSKTEQPSTSSQDEKLTHEDVFKTITDKLKESAKDEKADDMITCHGDVCPVLEDKPEEIFCTPKTKLCSCQYVCEKCILRNMFDETDMSAIFLQPEPDVVIPDEAIPNRDSDYDLHRATTMKLGINDEMSEKEPVKPRQLTPAELVAFLRDEPQPPSLGAYKKQLDWNLTPVKAVSTACGSDSGIWSQTVESDRILVTSDLDVATSPMIKITESETCQISPANSVQLLCENFDEDKPLSLSNRMSCDSLEDEFPERGQEEIANADALITEAFHRCHIVEEDSTVIEEITGTPSSMDFFVGTEAFYKNENYKSRPTSADGTGFHESSIDIVEKIAATINYMVDKTGKPTPKTAVTINDMLLDETTFDNTRPPTSTTCLPPPNEEQSPGIDRAGKPAVTIVDAIFDSSSIERCINHLISEASEKNDECFVNERHEEGAVNLDKCLGDQCTYMITETSPSESDCRVTNNRSDLTEDLRLNEFEEEEVNLVIKGEKQCEESSVAKNDLNLIKAEVEETDVPAEGTDVLANETDVLANETDVLANETDVLANETDVLANETDVLVEEKTSRIFEEESCTLQRTSDNEQCLDKEGKQEVDLLKETTIAQNKNPPAEQIFEDKQSLLEKAEVFDDKQCLLEKTEVFENEQCLLQEKCSIIEDELCLPEKNEVIENNQCLLEETSINEEQCLSEKTSKMCFLENSRVSEDKMCFEEKTGVIEEKQLLVEEAIASQSKQCLVEKNSDNDKNYLEPENVFQDEPSSLEQIPIIKDSHCSIKEEDRYSLAAASEEKFITKEALDIKNKHINTSDAQSGTSLVDRCKSFIDNNEIYKNNPFESNEKILMDPKNIFESYNPFEQDSLEGVIVEHPATTEMAQKPMRHRLYMPDFFDAPIIEPPSLEQGNLEERPNSLGYHVEPSDGEVSSGRSSGRSSTQEERASRKSGSRGGIKMRMKKRDDMQSSNSHESFLHRDSHYEVYAAHGDDYNREEEAHSQNSSDNEYY